MKKEFLDSALHSLKFQRNIFAGITFLLAATILLLSVFLFVKKERIVVVPPIIEKEFWVEGKTVSPTYLEQYGCFLGQLILGKSAHSAQMQRNVLLRHADPSYVGTLKNKLMEEEETLRKQNSSYAFYPVDVKVDISKKEVHITGDRLFFVSGKQVSQEREEYTLSFSYIGSRLLLNGISSKPNKGGSHG